MARGAEFDPGRPERCRATYDGHRCSLKLGHADSHKVDTGTELVNFHDSEKGAPGKPDIHNPDNEDHEKGDQLVLSSKGDMVEMDLKGENTKLVKGEPKLFDKGGEGRYGHALFYRGKFTGARNRVIPKEDD